MGGFISDDIPPGSEFPAEKLDARTVPEKFDDIGSNLIRLF